MPLMLPTIRRFTSLLFAGSILLAPAIAAAHPVVADGDPSDWLARQPSAANVGLVARDAMGRGEYVWRDAIADTRTDIATPEVTADIAAFQVTGSPTGLAFLLRRQPGTAFPGQPIQVQIAIDMDRVAGSGQDFLAAFADTKVADGARWERLVQTLFGSGGKAQVIDAAFNKVADAEAAVGAGGDVEIFVPWAALGLTAPPTTPLRFTVATFRAQNDDLTVDVGGAAISNAIDCVSDYGDPAAAMHPNTWNDVMDQVVDYSFDLWFDTKGEVIAPLVAQSFLVDSSGGGPDEWYAVRNVTGATIALDDFKIGDEETPDGNEGMFVLPAGATIAPGATYVIARGGAAYQAFFGKAPDAELPPGASMAVPDLTPFAAWTSAATPGIDLGNAGDELLVLDPSNTILDVAVYGDGAYAGVASFTTAPAIDEVLTRDGQSSDTDDGQLDFTSAGVSCTSDAQCGGICTQCAGNVCGNKPMGASCADANPCDGDEVCDGNGACGAAIAPPCDDSNLCTVDACSAGTGCTHTPVAAGTSCSDSDVCNGVEVCDAAGACLAGTSLDCADTDPCTLDACDSAMGCQHTTAADGASCDDGDACNGGETCVAGACTQGAAPDCDDGNPCTADACDAANGCTHTAVSDGIACGDGDVCNGDEVCAGGVCGAGTALSCDDGDACTIDACDATTGCSHANAADGTACTGVDCEGTCTSGACDCGSGGSGGTGTGSASSSSSGSASSSSGSGNEGGSGGSGSAGSGDDGGCGCRVAGGSDGDEASWLAALVLGLAVRRRRARPSGAR